MAVPSPGPLGARLDEWSWKVVHVRSRELCMQLGPLGPCPAWSLYSPTGVHQEPDLTSKRPQGLVSKTGSSLSKPLLPDHIFWGGTQK